jgi:hypothetical protein
MSYQKPRTRRGAASKASKTDIWEGNPTVVGVFASFLRSVADADATWYSLKPLEEGTPYIGDILGLSSKNTFAYYRYWVFARRIRRVISTFEMMPMSTFVSETCFKTLLKSRIFEIERSGFELG